MTKYFLALQTEDGHLVIVPKVHSDTVVDAELSSGGFGIRKHVVFDLRTSGNRQLGVVLGGGVGIHEAADTPVLREAVHKMTGEDLVGVISERDYARQVILLGRSSKDTQVNEIMTTEVVHALPTMTVRECLALMTLKRIRHLPIRDEDLSVVGVVSIGDLAELHRINCTRRNDLGLRDRTAE